MMNILLDTLEKEFPNVTNITADLQNINDIDKDFIIPQEIKRRALVYLVDTHDIFKWFIETYKRVDITKQTPFDYLSLRNVLTHLNTTEYYKNLSATMKKKTSLSYFVRLFKDNELFKHYYIEKIDTHINSKPFKRNHVLKGWRLVEDDDTKDNEVFNNMINNTNDNIVSTTTNDIMANKISA